jgi:hypothetical protein
MTKTMVPGSRSNSSKGVGVAAIVVTVPNEGVTNSGICIVYNRPVLFDLMIMFLIVRSFTDKPKGSNSIEHQLSVVKQ